MSKDVYENPLITRYAGREMAAVFSDDCKFKLWRKLWVTLAEAEKELGLPITDAQIEEMRAFAADINYGVAEAKEKETRHDVMAHVYAFGAQAKSAAPIIHLGATSCFVGDNADLITYYDALKIILSKLVSLMDRLAAFALKYKDTPTLGFTHLQPAQLTTVGKRAALWLQDLLLDYGEIKRLISDFKLRGVKGTTGTQASFLSLFDGDAKKVDALERAVVRKLGFKAAYGVTGQTYPRKFDYSILSALSGVCQSAAKFAGDLRLLQSMKEMEEPFETEQIGSSAMAYKRNPMRCERLCALARFAVSLPVNAAMTASNQWFERTLDDSANKRVVMAQGFLAADAALNLYLNVAQNLIVYGKIIDAHIRAELPFMATETILMECVKAGGDRQKLHGRIRVHSMESAKRVKEEGLDNDLLKRIKGDAAFAAVKDRLGELTEPRKFIGLAPEQTAAFIENEIKPVLKAEKALLGAEAEVRV